MKKAFFSAFALVALTFGVSSCSNCKTCKKSGFSDITVCKKDYADNQVLFDAAVSSYVAAGYSCK